ncbi:MAG: hypothetical protein EBR28_12570 [Planctomycetia bacterium]|nr:hypothetical protein [Planctomycetia bacterium]
MVRKLIVVVCLATTFLAPVAPCVAQGVMPRVGAGGGGILARLNKPISPRLPTLPGVPTFSPLGLIAPRLSNIVSIGQLGGMRTQAGRLSALGVLSPRISPVVALMGMRSATPQARRLYALTILSPRAAVVVGMLKAFSGMAGSLR